MPFNFEEDKKYTFSKECHERYATSDHQIYEKNLFGVDNPDYWVNKLNGREVNLIKMPSGRIKGYIDNYCIQPEWCIGIKYDINCKK